MTSIETTGSQLVNLHEVEALQEVRVRDDLLVRPLEYEDAEQIIAILDGDPTIRDRVSVASKMHSTEDVRKQVDTYRDDPHLVRYAIVSNKRVAGLVSFWRDVDNPFDSPDNPDDYGFGYFLDPDSRGQGIVTSVVSKFMQVADENLFVDNFIAYCEDNNDDSVAVLANLGFVPTDVTLEEKNSGWLERKFVKPNH